MSWSDMKVVALMTLMGFCCAVGAISFMLMVAGMAVGDVYAIVVGGTALLIMLVLVRYIFVRTKQHRPDDGTPPER